MPRSLNDIIPPSRRRSPIAQPIAQESAPLPPQYSDMPRIPKPRSRSGFPYGTALIALIVVALAAVGLYAFSGASVEITPVSHAVTVSGDFTATPSTGDLPYEIISVQKTESQSATAEGTEVANDKAQGTVTILNAGAVSQPLTKGTRLATPAGLIFRINDPVTVPPGTAVAPGSVTATVTADAGGDTYNIDPTAFTIPGLKGSKAYALVTAKSTSAMSGGFAGTRPSVSQDVKNTEYQALDTRLAPELATALKAKIPAGYVLIQGGSVTSYAHQADTAPKGKSVTLNEQGTVTAVVFPSAALAKAAAYRSVGTYSGEPVDFLNANSLTLKPQGALPAGSDPFVFSLQGTATIVWQIDTTKIAGAVAGKTRDSAQVVLSGFPEVDRAILILRPFWTLSFPQDPTHIKVKVVVPVGAK